MDGLLQFPAGVWLPKLITDGSRRNELRLQQFVPESESSRKPLRDMCWWTILSFAVSLGIKRAQSVNGTFFTPFTN